MHACAGPDSPTHTELLQLLGGASNSGLTEQQLNALFSGLSAQLQQAGGEGGQDSGAPAAEPGAELLVANSIWSKGVAVLPEYVSSMSQLFQVCGCGVC